jgi:hypothetical protein
MSGFYLKRLFVLFALCAAGTLNCSKSSSGGDEADDGNTPYVILDLQVAAVTDSTALLTWTATGDDADQGTASTYDMRYWYKEIDPDTWDSATQATSEPTPKPAGQKDSMWVRGLKKDSTYYFLLVTCDEAGNCAGSLCAHGTCFDDVVVTFPDYHLDSVIRVMAAKPTGDIHRSDLMVHDFLDANWAGISSLSGIECWTSLRNAALGNNSITNLQPLAGLTKLNAIGLTGNGITDITPLAGLVNLTVLHLRSNSPSSLSSLSGMTNLQQLDLSQTSTTDLTPLSGMVNLISLYLQGNGLTNLSAMTSMTNLEILDLTDNDVVDLTPLAGLTHMQVLHLGSNKITDLTPLAGLVNLTSLQLRINKVTSLSPLSGMTNLQDLDVTETGIADITPLASLASLRGAYLANNRIADITALQTLMAVHVIDLTYDSVTNLYPLVLNTGLATGDTLKIGHNPLSTESTTSYVPALQARGVIVLGL